MTDTTSTSSPTPTSLASDDPRAAFASSIALAGVTIDAVRHDQLGDPTPGGMDVRLLLEHLVMVLHRVTSAGRAEPPREWPVGAPGIPDEGFGDAWRAAAAEVQAVWADDALLDRSVDLPWGTFPGREVLAVYTNEVTVHTWDLAQGTDQTPTWDPTVLAVAEAAIHDQLPMPDRTAMWEEARVGLPPGIEWEDPFGPAVPVADDAPAIDRLVAWNGRQP